MTDPARDPVCGMTVDRAAPKGGTHVHDGQTYGFCSPRCREKFASDPQRYLAPAPPAPAQAGVEYTCPMHPEIVRDAPGSCPICGMALEPRTATLTEQANSELVDMTRRLWAGLIPTIPLFALSMAEMLPGQPVQHAIGANAMNWIQAVLATPVVLWGGAPFFERGARSVRSGNLNMFTLIALGTGVAYVYSLTGTLSRVFSHRRCAVTAAPSPCISRRRP